MAVATESLAERIDAEFSALEAKVKHVRSERLEEQKGRQQRLEQLGKLFEKVRELAQPRLEVLVKKFQDRVKVTPKTLPSTREVTFDFQSKLAHVRLRFSASTDRDVRKLILGYDLEIIPVLMRFNPHAELEFPMDAFDEQAAGKWIDDRIVEFVQTYLSLHQNEAYLEEQMVEDPIAHVRFPSLAAAASLSWRGQKFYFISEETRHEFVAQNAISAT